MNNDTSQRSVATWFRCGGTFDRYFIINLLLNHSTFGKVMGETLLASGALCAGALPYWKMKNSLEICILDCVMVIHAN